ncbi:hypothetical protein ACFPVX_04410 [Cohnella faecalis]|uniref:Uncharacterized protein n=1 Tax=Cohnella faecalis TaxID=2315694 RepID=A0A398CVD8_9BACL|nr:hypothetical protein [Cohnella faecalis]RIE03877.1 hypothetical protein D3H35_07865 [Cohnella faecalis]
MERKSTGKTEKILLIIGFILGGIILILFIAAIIAAMLKRPRKSAMAIKELPVNPDTAAELAVPPPPTNEQRLARAIDLHNEGVAGNAEAVKEADREFERLRRDCPGNPVADAFHGSVKAMLARDETDLEERFLKAIDGLSLLDEAVAASPQDVTIRILRGKVAYWLPEPVFQRTETTIEDYVVVIDKELRKPGSLDGEIYFELIDELSQAYRRLNRQREAELCGRKLLVQRANRRMKQTGTIT